MPDDTLLHPKDIKIKTLDGDERTYFVSRLPAIAAREVITQYPISATPKVGDYARNVELMLRLMSYCGVVTADGSYLRFRTQALIDNHVPDGETLMRLEFEAFNHNTSFFRDGKMLNTLDSMFQRVIGSIAETLTRLSAK